MSQGSCYDSDPVLCYAQSLTSFLRVKSPTGKSRAELGTTMTEQNYPAIAAAYPRHIAFPHISRPHRSGKSNLTEVGTLEDLPSRLLFGDIVPESFTGAR